MPNPLKIFKGHILFGVNHLKHISLTSYIGENEKESRNIKSTENMEFI